MSIFNLMITIKASLALRNIASFSCLLFLIIASFSLKAKYYKVLINKQYFKILFKYHVFSYSYFMYIIVSILSTSKTWPGIFRERINVSGFRFVKYFRTLVKSQQTRPFSSGSCGPVININIKYDRWKRKMRMTTNISVYLPLLKVICI